MLQGIGRYATSFLGYCPRSWRSIFIQRCPCGAAVQYNPAIIVHMLILAGPIKQLLLSWHLATSMTIYRCSIYFSSESIWFKQQIAFNWPFINTAVPFLDLDQHAVRRHTGGILGHKLIRSKDVDTTGPVCGPAGFPSGLYSALDS